MTPCRLVNNYDVSLEMNTVILMVQTVKKILLRIDILRHSRWRQ